ncbi:unnamed protein product [Amoebophrya sp. A25]|nr:unnamed protein product [Amoebophrya sp. A25]|eukprot:GSA25T00010158001.1
MSCDVDADQLQELFWSSPSSLSEMVLLDEPQESPPSPAKPSDALSTLRAQLKTATGNTTALMQQIAAREMYKAGGRLGTRAQKYVEEGEGLGDESVQYNINYEATTACEHEDDEEYFNSSWYYHQEPRHGGVSYYDEEDGDGQGKGTGSEENLHSFCEDELEHENSSGSSPPAEADDERAAHNITREVHRENEDFRTKDSYFQDLSNSNSDKPRSGEVEKKNDNGPHSSSSSSLQVEQHELGAKETEMEPIDMWYAEDEDRRRKSCPAAFSGLERREVGEAVEDGEIMQSEVPAQSSTTREEFLHVHQGYEQRHLLGGAHKSHRRSTSCSGDLVLVPYGTLCGSGNTCWSVFSSVDTAKDERGVDTEVGQHQHTFHQEDEMKERSSQNYDTYEVDEAGTLEQARSKKEALELQAAAKQNERPVFVLSTLAPDHGVTNMLRQDVETRSGTGATQDQIVGHHNFYTKPPKGRPDRPDDFYGDYGGAILRTSAVWRRRRQRRICRSRSRSRSSQSRSSAGSYSSRGSSCSGSCSSCYSYSSGSRSQRRDKDSSLSDKSKGSVVLRHGDRDGREKRLLDEARLQAAGTTKGRDERQILNK